jgi:hypothetical protein
MWLLHLLPDSFILIIVYALMGLGALGIIAGFFIKFIPWINIYRTPIQIVSIILFCSGVYWYGGYTTEMLWREEVTRLEEQVAEAEKKSAKTNTVIKKVYVDRVKIVKQDVVVVQEKIKEVEKLIDKECKVAPEAINLLNEAARPRKGIVEIGPLQPVSKDDKQ